MRSNTIKGKHARFFPKLVAAAVSIVSLSLTIPSFAIAQQSLYQGQYPFYQLNPYQNPYQRQYPFYQQQQQPGTATTTTFYDGFEGTPYTLSQSGSLSPNGKWLNVYPGYGLKGVTRQSLPNGGSNGYFFQYTKTATSPGESHGSLTTSTKAFGNFQMTINMKTVKQLRQNSLPHTWEVAWLLWHYTDKFHHYALELKTNGLEIQKKDNTSQCDACQIYLLENHNFPTKLGQWQVLTLRVTNSASGTPHIQVWVDGMVAANFIDNTKGQPNSPRMASGYMGLYNEDSLVNFDDVYVTPLS
jgi:hypothetical protein